MASSSSSKVTSSLDAAIRMLSSHPPQAQAQAQAQTETQALSKVAEGKRKNVSKTHAKFHKNTSDAVRTRARLIYNSQKRNLYKQSTIHTNTNTTTSTYRITTDFDELIRESNGARRYKVHESNCSCPKMKAFRDKMNKGRERGGVLANGDGDAGGLVVVPDTKNPRLVYSFHDDSAKLQNVTDLIDSEKKLRDIIFQNDKKDREGIKVSCAICLLERIPNGFVCISSTDKSAMDMVKDRAIQRMHHLTSTSPSTGTADKNTGVRGKKALHHDHFDFVGAFKLSFLKKVRAVKKSQRRREKKFSPSESSPLVSLEMRAELQREGILLDDMDDPNQTDLQIELGHHLMSIMSLLDADARRREGLDHHQKYIFVIMTKRERKGRSNNNNGSKVVLEIDLPGGKRHLGETTWECAIRETEEESSLCIDETWLVDDGTPMVDGDQAVNAYFMLEPPSINNVTTRASTTLPETLQIPPPTSSNNNNEKYNETLLDIEKNLFWTNTGLG